MTGKGSEIVEVLVKLLVKAIDGPAALVRAVCAATLSVAECLISCIDCGMASDIYEIKESLLRRIKAEGDSARGEGKRKLAEAAEAANRATLHKRNDAIARAELAQREATARKIQAEADTLLTDAETRRRQAETEAQARLIEAKARFIEAVGKLRQEGGEIFFDRKALQKMLEAGPSPDSAQLEAESK